MTSVYTEEDFVKALCRSPFRLVCAEYNGLRVEDKLCDIGTKDYAIVGGIRIRFSKKELEVLVKHHWTMEDFVREYRDL